MADISRFSDGNDTYYFKDEAARNALSIARSIDSSPYLFRKTPYASDRTYLRKLVGGSVAWNNYANPSNLSNSGITITVTDGIANIDGTASGTIYYGVATPSDYNGHVVYAFQSQTSENNCYLYNDSAGVIVDAGKKEVISRATANKAFFLRIGQGATFSNKKYSFIITDLTKMFGPEIADYIYTLEQSQAGSGIAYLRSYGFLINDYYATDSGSIQSVSVSGKKVVGFNQWDEVWELGDIAYSTGGNYNDPARIRSKNYIPVLENTTYYFRKVGTERVDVFLYDANKTYLGRYDGGLIGAVTGLFTVSPGAHFMRFAKSETTTYNNDICINLSKTTGSPKNGDYVPYTTTTYTLPHDVLRGIIKKDASNRLYYDGDERYPDKKAQRYEIVDLGTLPWAYDGSIMFADDAFVGDKVAKFVSNSTVFDCISAFAGGVSFSDVYGNKKGFCVSASGKNLYCAASGYTSYSDFKTAMSGVMLVYPLANPITTTEPAYQSLQIVDGDGTEEMIDYLVEQGDRDVAIPVGHSSDYVNLPDWLKDDEYITDLREKAENALQPDTAVVDVVNKNTWDGTNSSLKDTLEGYKEITGLPQSVVSFVNGSSAGLGKLKVDIQAVQSGSGDPSPTNIREISGFDDISVVVNGFNQWDEEFQANFFIDASTGVKGAGAYCGNKNLLRVIPNTTYCITFPSPTAGDVFIYEYGKNGDYLRTRAPGSTKTFVTYTSSADAYFIYFAKNQSTTGYGTTYNNDICINLSDASRNGTYEPYKGHTVNISMESAGTVYGATLDVLTGVLTVDKLVIDVSAMSLTMISSAPGLYTAVPPTGIKNNSTMLCSNYKQSFANDYSRWNARDKAFGWLSTYTYIIFVDKDYTSLEDFRTAMNGAQLLYELETPQTYQLTPTQVRSIVGENNIFADCGNVLELSYQPNNIVGEIRSNVSNVVEDTETILRYLKPYIECPEKAIWHNNIYRGKDLTDIYTLDEIVNMIRNDSFSDLYIGDYFDVTISTSYRSNEKVRCVIAELGYTSYGNFAVIVTKNCFYTKAQMNSSDTTEGGFAGSYMYETVLDEYAEAFDGLFGNAIGYAEIMLSYGIDSSIPSSAGGGLMGAVTDINSPEYFTLSLLTERMIFGTQIFSSSSFDSITGFSNNQLPLFRLNHNAIRCGLGGTGTANNRLGSTYPPTNYWLSNIADSEKFCFVEESDAILQYPNASLIGASEELGVRPYFILQ